MHPEITIDKGNPPKNTKGSRALPLSQSSRSSQSSQSSQSLPPPRKSAGSGWLQKERRAPHRSTNPPGPARHRVTVVACSTGDRGDRGDRGALEARHRHIPCISYHFPPLLEVPEDMAAFPLHSSHFR